MVSIVKRNIYACIICDYTDVCNFPLQGGYAPVPISQAASLRRKDTRAWHGDAPVPIPRTAIRGARTPRPYVGDAPFPTSQTASLRSSDSAVPTFVNNNNNSSECISEASNGQQIRVKRRPNGRVESYRPTRLIHQQLPTIAIFYSNRIIKNWSCGPIHNNWVH